MRLPGVLTSVAIFKQADWTSEKCRGTVDESCVTLRTLNYGNSGLFLIMGNAGFISST